MKQTTFTLLLLAIIAMVSCRKDKYDPTINQYDEDQIKAYITANGVTGMNKDTSGMYYKIINPGRDTALQYTSNISMVFTVRTLDGKFVSEDTIANHFDGYAGHILTTTYPLGLNTPGLQMAIHNLVNHAGSIARIIVPSHLGYGVSGAGSGSSSVTTGRIAGNQCLDYYIHIITSTKNITGANGRPIDTKNQDDYDQLVIKNYIAAKGLTGYKQDVDGYWYAIERPGTGTVAITDNSTVYTTYTTALLNGTVVDEFNTAGQTRPFDIPDLIPAARSALKKYATSGALLTVLIPSSLAYGKVPSSIPPNSVLRYGVQVIAVTP